MDKQERNRVALLEALQNATGPITSSRLAQMLAASGHHLSERTVRLYLGQMDTGGLTESHGRRGRVITEKGRAEIHAARTFQRVGYLSARIDKMTYSMSFDPAIRSGTVVVNTSVVNPRNLADCIDQVCKVFADGLAMGNRVALIPPGETVGGLKIPNDRVGFCTVCSITLNGVLLKHGVPTHSRFGGLLELRERRAIRFVEMIHYDGTSIDPLEVFIRSRMTNYCGAIRNGTGLIGASFREMPENSRELVVQLDERLSAVGLGAFWEIGLPGHSILDLPVTPGCIGSVVIGGLNPIAILEELGYRVESRALAGLLDYSRLYSFEELPQELQRYL